MGNVTYDDKTGRVLIGGGLMMRNGGRPYYDGRLMRCASCNGVFENGACQTCGAVPQKYQHEKRADGRHVVLR
jgi:hypothetical protein